MSSDPIRLSDVEYLLELGVTLDDIAGRAGRTPGAIEQEIRNRREQDDQ